MKLKILFLNIVLLNGAFALSLGDIANNSTLQTEANPSQTIKLAVQDNAHKEYLVKSVDGNKTILVNSKSRVYGFKWSEQNPNLTEMLGKQYLDEFKDAYSKRSNKGNHRMLSIETTNLSIHQFGLPDGVKNGEMIDKNLSPEN
jgi:hypothetical protein